MYAFHDHARTRSHGGRVEARSVAAPGARARALTAIVALATSCPCPTTGAWAGRRRGRGRSEEDMVHGLETARGREGREGWRWAGSVERRAGQRQQRRLPPCLREQSRPAAPLRRQEWHAHMTSGIDLYESRARQRTGALVRSGRKPPHRRRRARRRLPRRRATSSDLPQTAISPNDQTCPPSSLPPSPGASPSAPPLPSPQTIGRAFAAPPSRSPTFPPSARHRPCSSGATPRLGCPLRSSRSTARPARRRRRPRQAARPCGSSAAAAASLAFRPCASSPRSAGWTLSSRPGS